MKKLTVAICFLFSACMPKNNDKAIGDGLIHTGGDVPSVNLWATPQEKKEINATLTNYTPVDILDINGEYYYIRNRLNRREYGYCLRGFVDAVTWYQ